MKDIDARRSDHEFFNFLKSNKVKYSAVDIKLLRTTFGSISDDAPEVHEKPTDKNSELVIDTNLNDTEKVPFKDTIEEYFEREVIPYAPDAWMDRSKDKIGCEFPFTRIFYKFRPLRSADEIIAEINRINDRIHI